MKKQGNGGGMTGQDICKINHFEQNSDDELDEQDDSADEQTLKAQQNEHPALRLRKNDYFYMPDKQKFGQVLKVGENG